MRKIIIYLFVLLILSILVFAQKGIEKVEVSLPTNGIVTVSGITEKPNVVIEIVNPRTNEKYTVSVGEDRKFFVRVSNVEEGQQLDVTVIRGFRFRTTTITPNSLGEPGKIVFSNGVNGGYLGTKSMNGAFNSPVYFGGKFNQVVLFPGYGLGFDSGRALADGLF